MILNKRSKLILACTHSLGAKFFEGQLSFMRERGFDVYVICAPGKEIEKLCHKEQATFIPVAFKREIDLISDVKTVFSLIKILKEIRPDIINTGTPKAGLLVALAAKIIDFKPVIFTLRGLRSETLLGVKKLIVRSMEKFTCLLASYVIPISPSLSVHAQNIGVLNGYKSVVLGLGSSNGVNVERFSPRLSDQEKHKIRNHLNILPNDFLISYVGRINQDKGVAELFLVFKKLANVFPDVKLLIVGKFEEENSLPTHIIEEMKSHPSVILEGYRDNVEVIYEVIDLLVLYSKREGFGNILIEASCMGVPVIASNIPGCQDAVNDGVSGYLVDSNDQLYEKLLYYIQNRSVAREHGEMGQKWVRENFESSIVWNKQFEFYNKLLNG